MTLFIILALLSFSVALNFFILYMMRNNQRTLWQANSRLAVDINELQKQIEELK